MSTHNVDVFHIQEIFPHYNADNLSIIKPFGFQVVVQKDSFKVGDLVAYCPPDTIVPFSYPDFSFLQKNAPEGRTNHRVKVIKLRGEVSQGLLIKAPHGSVDGENIFEQLGCQWYEAPEVFDGVKLGGKQESGPSLFAPVYDLENVRRYHKILLPNEPLILTEKIHGSSARFFFDGQRFWCGSHRQWKRLDDTCVWWKTLYNEIELQNFLTQNPDHIVYGEIYGQIQKGYTYGVPQGGTRLAVFDILANDRFLDYYSAQTLAPRLPWVPVLAEDYPYKNLLDLGLFAEGKSMVPGALNIREGCVIQPVTERFESSIGRIKLKMVGNQFLIKD